MTWVIAGLVYAAAYAASAVALRDAPLARLWVGNLGLLVSPLVPAIVVLRRRQRWRGRQLVFFDAIAIGAGIWFLGQVGWAVEELLLDRLQPWLSWDIVPQLCGSMMPLIALIAAPHRGARRHSATTTALDIYGVLFLFGFVCWAFVIAPGFQPEHRAAGVDTVSILGPAIRAAGVVGLCLAMRATPEPEWRAVYGWLAAGIATSFAFLVVVSAHVIAGSYLTGSVSDVAWILPFWFFAAAVSAAPASAVEPPPSITSDDKPGPPLLLFIAIFVVPAMTLLLRQLVPLQHPADSYREIGEDLAMIGGIGLAVLRVAVEQRAVRRYERRLRLLATACEEAHELIVIIRGRSLEYANTAFYRAVGYTRAEIATLDQLLLDEESYDTARAMLARLQRGEPAQATVSIKRRDGSTFAAAVSAAPIVDHDRTVDHFVAIVHDLTEDLVVRDKLVRSERLSAIGELVSSIAHQINNPLQSVIGTVDVVLATPGADAVRPDLERVRLEAWRAGHTIRNLLTFARRTAGARQLGEINELIESTLALCAYDLHASRIRVAKEFARDLPLVLINREEMQQVVLNLIVNAQQSLGSQGEGGTLTLRTFLQGTDAVFEVADDGPGIAPELAHRLFEPFVSTKPVTEATGLGLSTAFGIVVAHSGSLELVPTSAGACFRVTLPGAGFAGPVVHSV